jgi:hypothetical protein
MPKSTLMVGAATAALSLVLFSNPGSAQSQSLDDVMRRLDRLEKENVDLKKQTAVLPTSVPRNAFAADMAIKAPGCPHGFGPASFGGGLFGPGGGSVGANSQTITFPSAQAQQLFLDDIADEDAFKVAALYKFATGTTIGGIFESFHRYVPADLQFQNERQRLGTWVFLSQQLSKTESVHFGWAHAFRTPGDPGQHNNAVIPLPGDTTGLAFFANNNNSADMLTAAYRRNLSSNLSWYTNVAATLNRPDAHFDLGAGGHGITTDCADSFGSTGGGFSQGPHCWTGAILLGVSTGLQWRF